jgi:hypothetical protein
MEENIGGCSFVGGKVLCDRKDNRANKARAWDPHATRKREIFQREGGLRRFNQLPPNSASNYDKRQANVRNAFANQNNGYEVPKGGTAASRRSLPTWGGYSSPKGQEARRAAQVNAQRRGVQNPWSVSQDASERESCGMVGDTVVCRKK